MPLTNHMEIAVTFEIFLNTLGYKCLEEVEILVLQKFSSSPVMRLSPKFSAEISNQTATAQQSPRGHAKSATAQRQGLCVLQGQNAPPAALVLQFAWQL